MSDLLARLRDLRAQAQLVDPALRRPLETVIEEVISPTEAVVGGKRTLVFGTNNYFGLTHHPEVIAAAGDALRRFGVATTGSRIANGTLGLHRDLEHDLAAAFGKRAAAVFTTGYQGNLAAVTSLCARGDFVLLDGDCHASLYDAATLSGATIIGFRHNDVGHLTRQLSRLPGDGRNRLVVIEGLYSIQGDVSPLPDIVGACRDHRAYLMLDEAHSMGAYGARGLGWAEHHHLLPEVDFIVGTFSKTLAGVGGFLVSDHEELEALHLLARPYLFTASGSPANIAGVRAALAVMLRERERADQIWANVAQLRAGLQALGYRIGGTASPITPIQVSDQLSTLRFWQGLTDAGLYVNVVMPPACPPDACLLRMSVSAVHTDAQIDQALAILASAGRAAGLIPA